jgi:hypothetical protein
VHENDEGISDLNVVLGAETGDDRPRNLKVPFVTHVTEVLIPNAVILVGALKIFFFKSIIFKKSEIFKNVSSYLIADPEFGNEPRIICTLLIEGCLI